MKSNVQAVLNLFEPKRRYVVPLFQRQYVWSLDRQWAPLWDDIERKVIERLRWSERLQSTNPEERERAKRIPPSEHFLGAIVLDHHPTFGNEVGARLIIDGQQRLTTAQVFLAALRDTAAGLGVPDYPAEVQGYIVNAGIMAAPGIERYKVWTSRFDQAPFGAVVDGGGRDSLLGAYPEAAKAQGPRLVNAYLFFWTKLNDLLSRAMLSERLEAQPDAFARVKAVFETFQTDLQMVTIELEGQDDPQVIFETLNARGEPLLPSDLLRNYLFWRASREDAGGLEGLYDDYWARFDSDFWKKEERQGRLTRPRVDLFFYNMLQLKTGREVNVARLYHEYRAWSERDSQYADVRAELRDIRRYAQELEKLFTPGVETAIARFANILNAFDVKTVNPLVLAFLADSGLTEAELETVLVDLESYLVRRAICGLTAANYNRLFVTWTARLAADGLTSANLRSVMLGETIESGFWPDDARLAQAWLNDAMYPRLKGRGRMEYVLRRLELASRSDWAEDVPLKPGLTIEHMLPQAWIEAWPLPDGTRGVRSEHRLQTPSPESDRRDRTLQTIGNLTLLTQPLNTAVSNGPFGDKVREIEKHSLLALNRYFVEHLRQSPVWDESAIEARGRALLQLAMAIWPHPGRSDVETPPSASSADSGEGASGERLF